MNRVVVAGDDASLGLKATTTLATNDASPISLLLHGHRSLFAFEATDTLRMWNVCARASHAVFVFHAVSAESVAVRVHMVSNASHRNASPPAPLLIEFGADDNKKLVVSRGGMPLRTVTGSFETHPHLCLVVPLSLRRLTRSFSSSR